MSPITWLAAALAAIALLGCWRLIARQACRRARFQRAVGQVLDAPHVRGDDAHGTYRGRPVQLHRVRRVVTWEVELHARPRTVNTLTGAPPGAPLAGHARRLGVSLETRDVATGLLRYQNTANLPRALAPRLDAACDVAAAAPAGSPTS